MVGAIDCLAEQLARLDPVVVATEEGTEVGQGPSVFEAGIGAGEHFDRLVQQGLATIATGYKPGGPQRHAQGARGTEGPG